MFWIYNLVLTLLSPLWVPWWLIRSARRRPRPNWRQRIGDMPLLPHPANGRLWVHAVSVGEVLAVLPILREIGRRAPELPIVLSATTPGGLATAREHAAELCEAIVEFPLDVARFQLAAMTRIRPTAVALMETELWMNFLWAAKAVEAKTLLVNARISDRSFRRGRWIRPFYRAVLGMVDRALAQSSLDAERLRAWGHPAPEVVGNCKFDQAREGVGRTRGEWRSELGFGREEFVVVIGSTRGELEEEFVLSALEALDREGLRVVHAPRHLERAEPLAAAVERRLGVRPARRSRGETGPYLILDTFGELGSIYAAADVAIVGGGFSRHGGQNIYQPIAHGVPVLHGPHMANFRDISRLALEAGCSRICGSPEELRTALEELRADPVLRERMSEAARRLIEQHRGASARYAEELIRAARNPESLFLAPRAVRS